MEEGLSPQVEAILDMVNDHLLAERYSEAEALLRQAELLAQTPADRSMIWGFLGNMWVALGRHAEAEKILRDAILESPYGSRDAVFELFSLYQSTDKPWHALAMSLEVCCFTSPEHETTFFARQLDITGIYYGNLMHAGYASPQFRRALAMLQSLSSFDEEEIQRIADRLQQAEETPLAESHQAPYASNLVEQLRGTEHGEPAFRECMDQLSDLHLAQGNSWMSLLCSLEVLGTDPDLPLWEKHHHRAGELWIAFGDMECSALHYRELIIDAIQNQHDREKARSILFEIARVLKPEKVSEAELLEALQKVPDGRGGEMMLDFIYYMFRISGNK